MKRDDLRSKIIPTTIENTNTSKFENIDRESLKTTDLIYLDSYEEQFDGKKTDIERKISATDYAIMNNAFINHFLITSTGKHASSVWLRSSYNSYDVCFIQGNGSLDYISPYESEIGICPSLHYELPKEDKKEDVNIREVKDTNGKTIYHTLQIGEYPKTKVNEELSKKLESLYNGGKIQDEIIATGRWFSGNGQKESDKVFGGKHSPEFEYQGDRYVRIISSINNKEDVYSDETLSGKPGTIRWVKIEPISFVIKNWDEMPKSINQEGNGKAKYFDLIAEEAIIANIPFYPNLPDLNTTMWQNSTIRGFLNGIDVRNIQENGNVKYGASKGGNFTGECNFLNEAFNLSREPIIEYTIPDSEEEIPDDAFNGCITLKKLIVHSKVKSIGARAFEGLHFKYAYRTPKGELIFSQELPKNKDEYIDALEFEKIAKSFVGLDYNILVPSNRFDQVITLSQNLTKNKFSIPYVYALELIKKEKARFFYENSDFRFFKSEISEINDMLSDFPEEERLNFFKFATSLGCFSTKKILNENGKETEILLAQKACSLLARLLKTDEMKLR